MTAGHGAFFADGLAALYHGDAVNPQAVTDPGEGRKAVRAMSPGSSSGPTRTAPGAHPRGGEAGDWATLERRDPLGLRGCGFFHVEGGRIRFQRGYFDPLTFLRGQGLPLPTS